MSENLLRARILLNSSNLAQANPTLYRIIDLILNAQLTGDGEQITNLQSANLSGTIPSSLLEDYKFPQTLIINNEVIGNSGSTETTIYEYNLDGNQFAEDDYYIRGLVHGEYAANGNNKTIRIKFAGTTIDTLGPITTNDGGFWVDFVIARVDSDTARPKVMFITKSAATTIVPVLHDLSDVTGVSWPTSLTLEITAEGTSSDDIVMKHLSVILFPTPLLS